MRTGSTGGGGREEHRTRRGEILDRNFDSYQIPRFSWLPQIETILIENPDTPASGCGEPPIVNMGAVIANAIYDAVGARLLQLPMTPVRIQAGLRIRALLFPHHRTVGLLRTVRADVILAPTRQEIRGHIRLSPYSRIPSLPCLERPG